MVRTNQGGSVLSFIIIGVVLVGLLVGGAYVVQQQATPETPPATPTPQQPENENEQPPASERQDKPTPQEQKDNGQESDEAAEGTPPAGNAGELPATGPAELLTTLFALGLLSMTAISYTRSRRPDLSL